MLTRRQLLKTGAAAGAAAGLTWGIRRAYPFAQSPTNIRKFVVNLPGLGPSGANQIGQYIPLATKTTTNFAGLSTDVYRLGVKPFGEKMHPDLKRATGFWGYYDLATGDQKYLAGVIVAKRGTPVLLNVTNQLPNKALIPVDPTIDASPTQTVGQLPLNRIATHLHGGFTPWFSDGTPFQWFTPGGQTGASFMNVPGTNPAAGTATYYYPMDQSARFVWYHDHAIEITRTNAYAGIASALIITDNFESGLISSGLLPALASALDIPLVIQDKTFVPSNILTQDPTWQWGMESDLWYPHVYEPNSTPGTGPNPSCADNPKGRWDYGPCASPPAVLGSSFSTLPTPASVVAEAFFDTILVNGGVYPVVSVPPKRVRFRMLNGSQARFYHLNLYAEDPLHPGEAQVGRPGPIMYQVGTEGGFLPAVAIHNNTTALPLVDTDTANPDGPFNLLLAPAERADVVIDFNGVAAGKSFILYNDSVAPFPGGDSRNDYFTGDGDQTGMGGAPNTVQGFGPNTRTLLKIVVTSGTGDSLTTTTWLNDLNPLLAANFGPGGQQPPLLYTGPFPYTGTPNRTLTLNEDFDEFGRLIQTLGTFFQQPNNNQGLAAWGQPYMNTATETPSAGAVEVWQLYNLTGDTHPIHFHLVNVQIIQRQAFTGDPTRITLLGPPTPPDPNEMGWKETVRMNPGEVTTVIAQFTLPTLPASMGNPLSPRTGGHEYVWHCHILEHEEHDMMRPLVVSWSRDVPESPMKSKPRDDTAGPPVGTKSENSGMLARISAAVVIATSLLTEEASAQGSWTQMKPIPQGANEVIGAAVEGLLYVYGGEREHTQHLHAGINPRTQPLGMFWAYDPKTDFWTRLKPNPVPVHHGAAAAIGKRFYLFGGFRLPDTGNSGWYPEDKAWVYDTETQDWSELPAMPTSRGAQAAVAVGDKIYVVGGAKIPSGIELPDGLRPLGPVEILGTTEMFDTGTNTWTALKPMTLPRNHHDIAYLDGKLYGGSVGSCFPGGWASNVSMNEVYDIATDTWSTSTRMPSARSGIGAAVIEGKIYVIGGEGWIDEWSGVFRTNESYDPKSDRWVEETPMPTARHGFAKGVIDGKLYTVSGTSLMHMFSVVAVNEVYAP